MRLIAFVKLYKMCTLLHRSKLDIFVNIFANSFANNSAHFDRIREPGKPGRRSRAPA